MTKVSEMNPAQKANFAAAMEAAGLGALVEASHLSKRVRRRSFSNTAAPLDLLSKRGRIMASGADGINVAGGWRAGGVGGLAQIVRGGRDTMQMTGNPTMGSTTSYKIRHSIPTTVFNNLGFWIETPNVIAGTYTIVLYYSPDVPAADPPSVDPNPNFRRIELLQGDIMYGSRQLVKIDKAGKLYKQESVGAQSVGVPWTSFGTADATSSISQIHIELKCDASVPLDQRWLNVDAVELDSMGIPLVMVGADGTTDTILAAMFARRGIPWYNAMDGNSLVANGAFLDDFITRGNEVVCNGQQHRNYGSDASLLASDIDACREIYKARGWPLDNTFAYPFNARSATTDAILIAKGFKLARSARHPPISYSGKGVPMTVPDPMVSAQAIMNVGSFSCDQQTAATMVQWTVDAKLTGHGYNAYLHNRTTSSTPSSVQTNETELATWLDDLKTNHEAGLIRLCLPCEAADLLGM